MSMAAGDASTAAMTGPAPGVSKSLEYTRKIKEYMEKLIELVGKDNLGELMTNLVQNVISEKAILDLTGSIGTADFLDLTVEDAAPLAQDKASKRKAGDDDGGMPAKKRVVANIDNSSDPVEADPTSSFPKLYPTPRKVDATKKPLGTVPVSQVTTPVRGSFESASSPLKRPSASPAQLAAFKARVEDYVSEKEEPAQKLLSTSKKPRGQKKA